MNKDKTDTPVKEKAYNGKEWHMRRGHPFDLGVAPNPGNRDEYVRELSAQVAWLTKALAEVVAEVFEMNREVPTPPTPKADTPPKPKPKPKAPPKPKPAKSGGGG